MKCPFKKIIYNKNRYGNYVMPVDTQIAKIETSFGECDREQCMAWNKGKCKRLERIFDEENI